MHVCILGMIAPHPCAHGIQVVEFPSGLDVGKEPVQKSENIICEDQHLILLLVQPSSPRQPQAPSSKSWTIPDAHGEI